MRFVNHYGEGMSLDVASTMEVQSSHFHQLKKIYCVFDLASVSKSYHEVS